MNVMGGGHRSEGWGRRRGRGWGRSGRRRCPVAPPGRRARGKVSIGGSVLLRHLATTIATECRQNASAQNAECTYLGIDVSLYTAVIEGWIPRMRCGAERDR